MTEIIKDRSMIDDKYKWDLTKVYKTNADFESDCKKVKNLITEYRKKYENHTLTFFIGLYLIGYMLTISLVPGIHPTIK